jgi:hypothetical protein
LPTPTPAPFTAYISGDSGEDACNGGFGEYSFQGNGTGICGSTIVNGAIIAAEIELDTDFWLSDGTNSRQVSKLLAVNLGTTTNYAEYGGMWVGPQIVDIFVTQAGGNIQLFSNAFTANTIQYNIVMTIYNN